jgi:hypothetical protein
MWNSTFALKHYLVAPMLAVGAFVWPSVSPAMTFATVELTCPYDGTKFKFDEMMSGTVFDRSFDLQQFGAIRSPAPLAECPTNGFVFAKEFSAEELEHLRPLILSSEYQGLRQETLYYRAAWIIERSGDSPRKVAMLLLQATWEAKSEEQYKRYATELTGRLTEELLRTGSAQEQTNTKMIAGEILRRLGRFDEARTIFTELAKDQAADGNLGKIVAFQIALIERRDTAQHRVSEVLDRRAR